MRDDRKKEIINSMKKEINQDNFSFEDLMSRKEKKKLKKQKKFEEKIIKELEQKKEEKRKKKLEETQKFEKERIKQALKEIEMKEQNGNQISIDNDAPKVNTIQSSYVSRNNSSNQVAPRKGINKFTKFILILTSIGILIFWIFNVITSFDRVHHIYTLVCSSLICFGCLLLVLAGMMTKNKPRSISNVMGSASLLSFAIINTLVLTNVLVFPTQAVLEDFSNRSINEAMKWAQENNVTLTPKYEYSDSIKKIYIITQSEKGEILA